jgi:23S rRNA pseudouridine2605 synthase
VLARTGVGSRRAIEDLIRAGRVAVNGQQATLGMAITASDRVEIDGRLIALSDETPRYVLLNKPPGVVSTLRDPQNRPTIRDLLAAVPQRIYPAGRLDFDSEGLLLCTNDGQLAKALTHPSHEVWKTYRVLVEGAPSPSVLDELVRGVTLDRQKTAPARFRQIGRKTTAPDTTLLEVQLREGRKRQIRRMVEAVGHRVLRLERVAIGPLSDPNLPAGAWRDLTVGEISQIRTAAGLDA